MPNLPLGLGAYDRPAARMPVIEMFNRYFEANPANSENGVALVSRPGTELFENVGTGPIRAQYTQKGTFDGDLFVVSEQTLWRLEPDGTKTDILGVILGEGTPAIVGTDEYLFIADGTQLLFYDGIGRRATGTLSITALPTTGQTVVLNGVTYTFKDTMTTAYDVQIGADMEATLDNLQAAVNADPNAVNVSYFVGIVANPFMRANAPRLIAGPTWTIEFYATVSGTAGNAYTTTETLTAGSFAAATLTGGVADALSGIQTPDDVAFVSLAVLRGFVLCLVSNSQRVYFIRPGETVIDPLDFFEAESIPDHGVSLRTIGDLVWVFGEQSSDAFYLSGAQDVPFSLFQGRSFSRGIVEGTDAVLDDTVVVVGDDYVVYAVTPGGYQRISNHGIENLIRLALNIERDS